MVCKISTYFYSLIFFHYLSNGFAFYLPGLAPVNYCEEDKATGCQVSVFLLSYKFIIEWEIIDFSILIQNYELFFEKNCTKLSELNCLSLYTWCRWQLCFRHVGNPIGFCQKSISWLILVCLLGNGIWFVKPKYYRLVDVSYE